MKQILSFFLIAFIICSAKPCNAQRWHAAIGAGLNPLHFSAQNDFKSKGIPVSLFINSRKRNSQISLGFTSQGRYQKDEFSFTHQILNLSFSQFLINRNSQNIVFPYVGVGANILQTKFTTQGYPGITAYTLKVERDKGVGGSIFAGIEAPIGKVLLNLQVRYDQNQNAQFIAGGFAMQKLYTSRTSLLVGAAIPLNIKSKHAQNACPEF